MKVFRNFPLFAVLSLTFSISLFAQSDPRFLSVNEIRPGMKGIGKTVFEGTKIEDFNVDILGVIKNTLAPKEDLILARLSGGPLDHTGVIAGMSGSPVYVDGRLIGAVAFSFNFSKDPIAGIQPIEQMIHLLDIKENTGATARASFSSPAVGPAEFVHNMIEQVAQGKPLYELLMPQSILNGGAPASATSAAALTPIATPLMVSGMSSGLLQQFMPAFGAFGLTPVQAGGSASPQIMAAAGPQKLEPGSSVNIEMVRGDFNYSANGTVTWVDGDKVYAFGHPNLGVGPTDLPMSAGYVITVLPNVQNSFKLAIPLEVVGSFRQDRNTGIAGKIGAQAAMIPVNLKINSTSEATHEYKFEVANDHFLTPLLMNLSIISAITASERAMGEMTLTVSGQVHLKNYDTVNISNIFSGDLNGPTMASVGAIAPIQYLLSTGYDGVVIQGVDLEIASTEHKTTAQLDTISVDKNEVHPGDIVNLTAFMRGSDGTAFQEHYPLQIPDSLARGAVQLLVGDGNSMTSVDIRRGTANDPRDVVQIIKELNKLRKNDRLYIKIVSSDTGVTIGGEELPSLPPSMAAVLNTDRSSNRSVSGTRSSTIREFELPQSKYVIQGQRTLGLTVIP